MENNGETKLASEDFVNVTCGLALDKYKNYVHEDAAKDAVCLLNYVLGQLKLEGFAGYKYLGIQDKKRVYAVHVSVSKDSLKEQSSKIELTGCSKASDEEC